MKFNFKNVNAKTKAALVCGGISALAVILTVSLVISFVKMSDSAQHINAELDDSSKKYAENESVPQWALSSEQSKNDIGQSNIESSSAASKPSENDNIKDFNSLYPDMRFDKPQFAANENKVYLTFDDGPSNNTFKVLSTLKDHNIKATFFVTCNGGYNQGEVYKKIAEEGHAIGIHTASHDYKKIYKSVKSYLDDFHIVWSKVKSDTGTAPRIFRFPGGSINSFNKKVYKAIIKEMESRGFIYFDWNVSSGDGSKTTNSDSVYKNVITGLKYHKRAVVLMHDSGAKIGTADALPKILDTLSNENLNFDRLDSTVNPVMFQFGK